MFATSTTLPRLDLDEINERIDALNVRLDALEDRLPTIPASVFRAQRASARLAFATAEGAGRAIADSACTITSTVGTGVRRVTGQTTGQTRRIVDSVDTGVKTVVDTAEAAASRSASTIDQGVRTVIGTAEAAASKSADVIEDEIVDLADQATVAAERARSAQPDDSWTKAELYDLAQELDIEGRSTMSKDELLDAVKVEA